MDKDRKDVNRKRENLLLFINLATYIGLPLLGIAGYEVFEAPRNTMRMYFAFGGSLPVIGLDAWLIMNYTMNR